MIVKSILSVKGHDVLTITPTTTLAEAAKTLAEKRIGALVITGADNRIVGIVTERDIVRAIAAHGASALTMAVSEFMTRKVVTCSEADTVASIMEQMTAGKFRHIPVVETHKLVGIISIGDVVKWRLHEMEQEHSAMRDYIQTA
jgi:CBS domain-containing protein